MVLLILCEGIPNLVAVKAKRRVSAGGNSVPSSWAKGTLSVENGEAS